jgi:glutathione peroxidase
MIRLLYLASLVVLMNVHQFSLNHPDGTSFSLGEFSGKKILLVNISTGSPLSYQLRGLQELHRIYQDSLVIIGVPTNSFGSEPHTATEIARICKDEFGVGFRVTQPVNVDGNAIHPLYGWLADGEANGIGPMPVRKDFQKFLFDQSGEVLGIYAAGVDPLDSSIHKAILGIR